MQQGGGGGGAGGRRARLLLEVGGQPRHRHRGHRAAQAPDKSFRSYIAAPLQGVSYVTHLDTEERRMPVMEVGGGCAEGGAGAGCGGGGLAAVLPGEAPDSERAGFCTAMI